MFSLDQLNADVTIVGCQSGTIPAMYNSVGQLPLAQIEFLLGSNPDIVILCVNIYDDFEYIRRTVKTIENLVETQVVALALSKMTFPENWQTMRGKSVVASDEQLDKFKVMLKTEFNLSAFVIGVEEDLEGLIDICIDSLGE